MYSNNLFHSSLRPANVNSKDVINEPCHVPSRKGFSRFLRLVILQRAPCIHLLFLIKCCEKKKTTDVNIKRGKNGRKKSFYRTMREIRGRDRQLQVRLYRRWTVGRRRYALWGLRTGRGYEPENYNYVGWLAHGGNRVRSVVTRWKKGSNSNGGGPSVRLSLLCGGNLSSLMGSDEGELLSLDVRAIIHTEN